MARTSKKAVREKKTYSWLMLLESRHGKPPEREPIGTGDRGRPRLTVATTQTSMTLSKGDREAIEFWQEQLSKMLDRKVSMGETVGFLARISQERLQTINSPEVQPETLPDFVQWFVTGEFPEPVSRIYETDGKGE
jgi:hypothetical protein